MKRTFSLSENCRACAILLLATGCARFTDASPIVCPTGEVQRVMIDTLTGEWKILSDPMDADTIDDDSSNNNNNDIEGLLSDTNARRLLPVDPENFQRTLSTDGSNSLVTSEESSNGNVDDTTTTIVVSLARTCNCFEDDYSGSNPTDETIVALCPENSGWCSIDGTETSAKCYSTEQLDFIVRNLWPMLWLWYAFIFVSVVCSFQGRILLDYVRGTILYYFCGFGDRFRNREMRNVDRYNYSIVEEILNDERLDRQNVRRRRNDGSVVSRRMDAIANRSVNSGVDQDDGAEGRVPPTIVTSPSFLGGGSLNDTDTDGEEDATPPSPMGRFLQGFRNVVWPWQTSWKRYIKYNLMMRVEWIAMQDEFAFIESRQQRGLPHARFEMKTRRWKADTDVCSCSMDPSMDPSLANSLDEPHCTICFSELEDGDKVGDLGCSHVFHADCLKMWVTKRNSCPLCNIPIARRKRITSDELVKEDVEAGETRESVVGNDTTGIRASNTIENSTDYEQTLPSVERYYGSPSNQQRRGPRRLTQMPMTPSTIAASNYSSEDEFEDLEAVDSGREDSSPIGDNVSAHIQEAQDENDSCGSENVSAATPPTGCNSNDYLEGEQSSTDSMEIPSPPRRIRRRPDENLSDGIGESAFLQTSCNPDRDHAVSLEAEPMEATTETNSNEFLESANTDSSPMDGTVEVEQKSTRNDDEL